MEFIGMLAAILLLLFLFDIMLARMFQNKRRRHSITPQKYGIPFEEIRIPLPDDGRLYGWWIPAAPEAPVLILVHGWGRNASRMLPYIRKLHPMGYSLLAIDARNHGSSTPVKPATVWSFSEDIRAAMRFLLEGSLAPNARIGVLGLSVGGGAAINAAAFEPRIQSVVTVGAIAHPAEVMKVEFQKVHIPFFPIGRFLLGYLQFRYGLDFEQIAPLCNIPAAKAPIFLIHGEKDATIPVDQGEALFKAGGPETTRLWIVPGKGHSNCDAHPEFWPKVAAFLNETIAVREPDEAPSLS